MRRKKAAERAVAAQQRKRERRQAPGGDTTEQGEAMDTLPEVTTAPSATGSAPWIDAGPTSVDAPPQSGTPQDGTPVDTLPTIEDER